MIDGFVKLYASIITSSIWLEDDATLRVWITMLTTADWEGYVGASVGGLAHVARVSREACVHALEVLEAPDPDSRSEEHEGRRIKKVEGGWMVLNIKKYRDMRSPQQVQEAERKARWRAGRDKTGQSLDVPDSPRSPVQMLDGDVDKSSPSPAREGQSQDVPDSPIDEATLTIHRFAHQFDNPESWANLLLGFTEGLGTEGGKRATRLQVALACNEANALGGDITPRRFRRILGQVMEKPEGGRTQTGNTLRAGEIIALVRKNRNPQFPNSALPAWRDELSQAEVRAVNAIGVDRILNDKIEGVVLAQLAKMLGEAGA